VPEKSAYLWVMLPQIICQTSWPLMVCGVVDCGVVFMIAALLIDDAV
jgi:hypothetical protein